MNYLVMKEIKSPPKINKYIYLSDVCFLMVYAGISLIFVNVVYQYFKIPFLIYSMAMGLILTCPSMYNPKRRNYESVLIYVSRNRQVYKRVLNVSNKI